VLAETRAQPFPRPAEVVRQAQRQLEEDVALMTALGSASTAKDMLSRIRT